MKAAGPGTLDSEWAQVRRLRVGRSAESGEAASRGGWLRCRWAEDQLCVLADGMEVDAASMEPGQFEDADVEHW